ncbi:MAG: histidine kinase [Deltaproteobacteria bacterium]|nr:histidine kinase [Deltaproteobacteria bacterium]
MNNIALPYSRKSFLIFSLIWLPLTLQISILLHVSSGMILARTLLVMSIPMVIELLQLLSLRHVCKAYPLGKTSITRMIVIFMISLIIIQSVWIFSLQGWSRILDFVFEEDIYKNSIIRFRLVTGAVGTLYAFVAVLFHYTVIYFENAVKAENHAVEKSLELSKAELKGIKTTIHPHFLFNSLNALSTLIKKDPESARKLTQKLSTFLRYSLKHASSELISVREEISHIEDYLNIEKIRFGKRLEWEFFIESSTENLMIPTLILLPLVENAVKHGIQQIVDGGKVEISVLDFADYLEISVKNPFERDSARLNGEGIGLNAVKGQLNAIYGIEAEMTVENTGTQFLVVLKIPLKISGDNGK